MKSRRPPYLRWVLVAVLVLAVVVILWNQGQHLIHGDSVSWTSYLLIAALVFGDAVCPVLPGETTLDAGALLAANGQLSIWLVVVSGAVGAVAGDSTVYWLARKAKGRVRHWMDRASDGATAGKVLAMLDRRGPIFLLFGRYIPGVRFALNAALGGVIRMPYRTFLAWSAVSGTLWSAVTCASAYYISSALEGYPLLSLIITGVASTLLISLLVWVQRHWPGHRAPAASRVVAVKQSHPARAVDDQQHEA